MEYVVFLGLVPVALAVLAALGVPVWRRREHADARALFVLGSACAGWVLTNAAEVVVPTEGATYALSQATYLFSAAATIAWFAFACTFADRRDWLRAPLFRAVAALLVVDVGLVFTTHLHGLMWRSVSYVPVYGGMLGIRVDHGPWFYVHAAVSWALLVAGSWLVVREYRSASSRTRRVSSLVAVGALVPLVTSVVYLSGAGGVGKDFTPLGTAAGAALMTFGIFRYQMLGYRPIARDRLVESLRDAVVAIDADGQVMDANPAFERLVGAAAPLIGRAAADVLPPPVLRALAPLSRPGSPTGASPAEPLDAPAVVLPVDGAERTFEVRDSPLTDRRGAPVGRLLLLHDITDRLAADDALRRANGALHARNDDLDAFSRTVAHDLKNPVHAIYGYAQILQIDGAAVTDDVREECIEAILDLSQQMAGIVDALLLLAGVNREAVATVPLAMDEIVPRALARLVVDADRAGAHVSGGGAASWPRAVGYAPWVEEMWVNYLSNAIKYGGAAPDVRIGAERRGAHVRFWVQDAGPGLSAQAQATLFHPFARLPGSDGHGLGLSIVRRIADRLGGDAGVESTGVPGEGSRFWFELPAAPDA